MDGVPTEMTAVRRTHPRSSLRDVITNTPFMKRYGSFLRRAGFWSEALVLHAREFDQLLVEHQRLVHAHGERLRVDLLVLDGDVDFHPPERRPAESLGDSSGACQWTAV